MKTGKVTVVGLGPGQDLHMTEAAKKAIAECDVVVGFKTYIKLIEHLITDQEVVSNGMRQEVERCKQAVELAEAGKNVIVVSSGDPGVYGMRVNSVTYMIETSFGVSLWPPR